MNSMSKETQEGLAPAPLIIRHISKLRHCRSKHWVPDIRLQVGAVILIETFSGSRVMFAYFKRFSHSKVVSQASFLFVLHGVDDLEVVLVEWLSAVLVVL